MSVTMVVTRCGGLRPALSLLVVLLTGLVPASSGSGAEPMTPRDFRAQLWTSLASEGKVETLPSGLEDHEWMPVQRGAAVEPLSELRTGRRGQTTLTRGGDLILVGHRADMMMPDVPGAGERVHQRKGSARYELRRRSGSPFEVMTPLASSRSSGAVFSVTVAEGFVGLLVASGRLEVRALQSGEVRELKAGDLAIVREGTDGMELYRDDTRQASAETDRDVEPARLARQESHRLASRSPSGVPVAE